MRRVLCWVSMVTVIGLAGEASAGNALPFYGYSPYFGGPSTSFSRDSDVEQATTQRDNGFGTRTYYRGGPFWRYQPSGYRRAIYSSHRRRVVLRRKG